jgi:SAM-dependent methyltransferase
MSVGPRVPPYFDFLIEDFADGTSGRFVHLGYWDAPPADTAAPRPDEFLQAQARLNAILLDMADLEDGQDVLDAGCGFGGTLDSINAQLHGARLTGVNIDPRQLAICGGILPRNGNHLHWQLADACSLPFADASFDRLLCIEAMFHFPSRAQFLAEAARVLRPGGVLVASDIVISTSARDFDTPAFPVAAWIGAGFGPWPDFWGEGIQGPTAGLRLATVRDAGPQTRPSHRFTVPPGIAEDRDPGSPTLRAALMLRWLHRNGHLRYPLMRFERHA